MRWDNPKPDPRDPEFLQTKSEAAPNGEPDDREPCDQYQDQLVRAECGKLHPLIFRIQAKGGVQHANGQFRVFFFHSA